MSANGNGVIRGGGFYGRVPVGTGHVCGKYRQPVTNLGVEACPNNRRASQQVPYEESLYEYDD